MGLTYSLDRREKKCMENFGKEYLLKGNKLDVGKWCGKITSRKNSEKDLKSVKKMEVVQYRLQ
jgi:hypothetical protein